PSAVASGYAESGSSRTVRRFQDRIMSHATTPTMATATSTPAHLSTCHLQPICGEPRHLVGGAHRALEERRVAAVEGGDDSPGQAASQVGGVRAASGQAVE